MPTPRFLFVLCLVLLSVSTSVFADQHDDCMSACNEALQPCVDQAKLNAGNVQEEQDMIAACQKSKADCIDACRAAEVQTQPPPQYQPEVQQENQPREQQPKERQGEDTLNGTIKIYKFE